MVPSVVVSRCRIDGDHVLWFGVDGVVKRSGGLRADPATIRAWQQRSQAAALERRRHGGHRVSQSIGRRRDDGPWARQCLEVYGPWCRACGSTGQVQVDHLIPRAQGGPSILENGLILGGPFGCGCHDLKTAHRLLIKREWLTAATVSWLGVVGHVWWDDSGEVWGRHRKLFAPIG